METSSTNNHGDAARAAFARELTAIIEYIADLNEEQFNKLVPTALALEMNRQMLISLAEHYGKSGPAYSCYFNAFLKLMPKAENNVQLIMMLNYCFAKMVADFASAPIGISGATIKAFKEALKRHYNSDDN
jgi:hypothetical protein